MRKNLTIAYYISGHGLGHAARACQVMAELPGDARIIARTMVAPEFLIRESGRDIEVRPGQFDVGVIQKDNRTLDWPETFKQARHIIKKTEASINDEANFLRQHNVDLVVCDVAPAPISAAKLAGIPSAVVGNFTWVDIFNRERRHFPEAGELADKWREQYAEATLAIRTEPAFPMSYFPRRETVELIARKGRNVRAELLRQLGLPRSQKLALLYFGTFGDGMMKAPAKDGITWLSFMPVPGAVTMLDPNIWSFPDIVASVDCVFAKPGYGTVGECMANGTPIVYHPRMEFAEYPVLRDAIESCRAGVKISSKDLQIGRWTSAMNRALELPVRKQPARGARQTAELILTLC